MHSAWIMLIIAGLLEVGWAIGLKASEGFTRPLPSVLTLVAMAASFFLLARAMQVLPVGTAYAIWVGIGALGTVAESVDGVFTGRLVGDILHGTGKAHAVRSLAIREGLNLRRCTAYSDSFNDVPMLSLVGTAVAINPDAALRETARKRGWEIRDFRTARRAARIGVPVGATRG